MKFSIINSCINIIQIIIVCMFSILSRKESVLTGELKRFPNSLESFAMLTVSCVSILPPTV